MTPLRGFLLGVFLTAGLLGTWLDWYRKPRLLTFATTWTENAYNHGWRCGAEQHNRDDCFDSRHFLQTIAKQEAERLCAILPAWTGREEFAWWHGIAPPPEPRREPHEQRSDSQHLSPSHRGGDRTR